MHNEAFKIAAEVASKAAKPHSVPPTERHRWVGQNKWDLENLVTESTRFTVTQDKELRRCCREAGVNRSQLISFMLKSWMEAWKNRNQKMEGVKNNGIQNGQAAL